MPSPIEAGRNLLFLMTDQHRTDTIGCYGGSPALTPALDSLAARGTVYDAAFTPTAVCTPARASLFTGLYPFEHGAISNFERATGPRSELDDSLRTLGHDLNAAGYAAGYVGKWHLGKQRGPEYYGFDGEHISGATNNYSHPGYQRWLAEHGHPPVALTDEIFSTLPDGSRGHLLAARLQQPTEATFEQYLADQTIDLIRRYAEAERPFVVVCSFFGPHLPYVIPDEWFDLFDPADINLPASMSETFDGKPEVQRTYARFWGADLIDESTWRQLHAAYRGYVALIDHQIGRILDALQECGCGDDTVVTFTADHGEFTGAHRLNDKGPAMYDDIYAIPALVAVPGQQARRCDAFVTLLDFHATILDVIGADPSRSRGRSLLTDDGSAGRDAVVAEFHGHHFPYPQRMYRDRRYKLIVNPGGVDEFYDLAADPHELRNVAASPAHAVALATARRRLYDELVLRGDGFAQWLANTGHIPEIDRVAPRTAVERALEAEAH